MAPPWKNSVGAAPFNPESEGGFAEAGSPPSFDDEEGLLDQLIEPTVDCPLITAHGDAPNTKAKLNTMGTMMEIMVALTRRPGSFATPELKSSAMSSLLRMIMVEADAFAPVISTNARQHSWVTGQATKHIAHLVAKQWVEHGNHDISVPVGMIRAMFDLGDFNKFANHVTDMDYHVVDGKDDAATRVNLSMAKVASALYAEIHRFSFYQDPGAVLSHLLTRIMDSIQSEVSYLDVSADLRIARLQSLVGRLGDLVAAEYAESMRHVLDGLIDAGNNNPKGFVVLKAQVKADAYNHIDAAFDRANKGYQTLNAVVDQVLQRHIRTSPAPSP